jgi:hypothetical protein
MLTSAASCARPITVALGAIHALSSISGANSPT